MNEQMMMIGAFAVCTLINVILQTCKSILTIRSTRMVASCINAIAFGFYTIVLKQMGHFDMMTTVAVTMVANFIGVWFSMWLLDRGKKDKLWIIEVNTNEVTRTMVAELLDSHKIGYMYQTIAGRVKYNQNMRIYCYTQKESETVHNVIKAHNNIKYNITVSRDF